MIFIRGEIERQKKISRLWKIFVRIFKKNVKSEREKQKRLFTKF